MIPDFGTKGTKLPFWDDGSTAGHVQYGHPGPWDTAFLGGLALPGVCAVRSPGKTRKMQVASAAGAHAEELIDTGAENSDVSITCTLWMPEHLDQWVKVLRLINIQGGSRAKPKAIDVYHPALDMLGIHSIYIHSVGALEPSAIRGAREATILGREFLPKEKSKKDKVNTISETGGDFSRPTEFDARIKSSPPSVKGATP